VKAARTGDSRRGRNRKEAGRGRQVHKDFRVGQRMVNWSEHVKKAEGRRGGDRVVAFDLHIRLLDLGPPW
jgi:hypothetical protein